MSTTAGGLEPALRRGRTSTIALGIAGLILGGIIALAARQRQRLDRAFDVSPRSLTRVGNMVTCCITASRKAHRSPDCGQVPVPTDDERSRPMITLNVLYPNRDGATFDMDYYLTSHIPMLQRELGSALKGCVVEQGLGGRDPGTKAEFAVLCHLRFDSVEAYRQAMGPVGDRIRDDVANYSSEAPIVQLSDVKVVS